MSDQKWETSEPSIFCLWVCSFCVPGSLFVSFCLLRACLPLPSFVSMLLSSSVPPPLPLLTGWTRVLLFPPSPLLSHGTGVQCVNVLLVLFLQCVSSFSVSSWVFVTLCLCEVRHVDLIFLVFGAGWVRKCSCVCVSDSQCICGYVYRCVRVASQELTCFLFLLLSVVSQTFHLLIRM